MSETTQEENFVTVLPTPYQVKLDKLLDERAPEEPVLHEHLLLGRDYSRQGMVQIAELLVNAIAPSETGHIPLMNIIKSMALRPKYDTNEIVLELKLSENPLATRRKEITVFKQAVPVGDIREFWLNNYRYLTRLLRGDEQEIANVLNGKYQYIYFGFGIMTTTVKLSDSQKTHSKEIPYYQSMKKHA